MNDKLKKAYVITINDLEIAIRNCGIFDFKSHRKYTKLLKYYENKLKNKL